MSADTAFVQPKFERPKIEQVTAAAPTLDADADYHDMDCSGNNIDAVIPDPQLWVGRHKTLFLSAVGSNDVDLTCREGVFGKSALEALDMDAANDYIIIFSDGVGIHIIKNGIA